MDDASLVAGWPDGACVAVLRLSGGLVDVVAHAGDLAERRGWASISKLVVGLAFGVEHDWGLHDFTEPVGPRGATIANLLSHTSGLGLEEGDPVVPVGTRRVYSNYGVEYAVSAVVGEDEPAPWLDGRVFRPLGMTTSHLEGRPAAGVVGSTDDLVKLAVAWLRPEAVSIATRNRLITPYLPGVDGVVPGFGRFTPCPWGLGPEVRGEKHHWMGDWPADSFGHYGKSGALVLANAREQIAVVATSTEDFGAWAVSLWPTWTGAMRERALAT